MILGNWQAVKKSIIIWLKVYKKSSYHKGLEFELGFAYNALGQYEKTIKILNKTTTNDKKNTFILI